MIMLSEKIDISGEPTDWFEVIQDRGNMFSDATLDQQWIHVDPERAEIDGMKMGINLGWNKVRFVSPVAVGSIIRTVGKLKSVVKKGEMLELINEMTVEINGQDKPTCVAESVLRIAF